MKRGSAAMALVLGILLGIANADVTVEIICQGMATAISADGTVVVGNTETDYETFRWTEDGGRVRLGRASVPVLGSGAGTPDVSDDGTMISATILGEDSTCITQGRWKEGLGWEETMPPPLPDGSLMDNAYGSAWVEDYLGVLPGTFPGYGVVVVHDMTPDASVVVGYNAFDFAVSTGLSGPNRTESSTSWITWSTTESLSPSSMIFLKSREYQMMERQWPA